VVAVKGEFRPPAESASQRPGDGLRFSIRGEPPRRLPV